MLLPLLLALVAQQATDAGDEILVTATVKRCEMRIADRILSDKEFQARAAEWAAGKPVRIVIPAATDYKCRAKIMFRLNDHGVTRAEFVEIPAH